MNRNKEKGKYLERKVVNIFRKNNIKCHRAYTSGTGDREIGDIIFNDYHIIIECKNNKDFYIFNLFKNNKKIYKYISQLKEEEKKYIKIYNIKPLSLLLLNNYKKRSNVYILVKKEEIEEYLNDIDTYLQFKNDYILLRLNDMIKIIKENGKWEK